MPLGHFVPRDALRVCLDERDERERKQNESLREAATGIMIALPADTLSGDGRMTGEENREGANPFFFPRGGRGHWPRDDS